MKEKHISVTEDQHRELKLLAKKTGRTMRGLITILIKQYSNQNNS